MQLYCLFLSNGAVTKNSPLFSVSSSMEVVSELEDEVFCTRKFNLAAVISHSGNLTSGDYRYLVKERNM